jgi:hypothetical protein
MFGYRAAMTAKPRALGPDALIVAIVVGGLVGAGGAGLALQFVSGYVTAAAVAAVALVAWLASVIVGRRARARAAAAAETARVAAAESAAAAKAEAQARFDAITDKVQGVLVEIVASQQGLVRAAYPDDIMARLRAAEDAGLELLDDLATAIMPPGVDAARDRVAVVPGPRAADASGLPAELIRAK